MIVAHPVDAIRSAEAALMARLPDDVLMQRAASGLASACARFLSGTYGSRVVLFVGGGNNGGDALWAGARLARRGARVDALLLRPQRVHQEGLAGLLAAGGHVADGDNERLTQQADLIIDGIYGIGGRSGLDDETARLVSVANESTGYVVAVDVPSGIDPETGEVAGPRVAADITVTFGTYKTGLLVDPAAAAAGEVEFVDIGLGPYLGPPAVEALGSADVAAALPRPAREADKYRRGVVGVIGGSEQYHGAAVLAVGGAIHGGAGMVRFVGSDDVAAGVRSRWPEAVVSGDIGSTGRVQAWVLGPGLGTGSDVDPVPVFESGLPVLVDADGLRLLPTRFAAPALLTPHAGELARMFGAERSQIEAQRLRYAREAASRWNATVLLKGSTTVVAAPDGRVRVNASGTPALATAGSGDVLSGLAGSLLAAGLSPFDAGSAAAHIHGLAGRRAVLTSGYPAATDILAALSTVTADLVNGRFTDNGQ